MTQAHPLPQPYSFSFSKKEQTGDSTWASKFLDSSGFGKHIFSPSHFWPHQQSPSSLMMQVPVPQHLKSSVMGFSWYLELTICPAVVCHQTVVKFHIWTSQSTVLGDSPFHALAPHQVWARLQLMTHESNDIWFRQSNALLDGLKGCPVFPSHLNNGRDVSSGKICKSLWKITLHGEAPWLKEGVVCL